MYKLLVNSSLRSYNIHLGQDILKHSPEFLSTVSSSKDVYIITDSNVSKLYLENISKILSDSSYNVNSYILPSGEKTKSLNHIQDIYTWLIEKLCNRNSIIIALGGGVIGDAVGFAASTFMRGVTFVQVPTTLLAMVDSSIGGKVGINHTLGKNLIGSFYPPHLVIQDVSLLASLSARELSAGLAECVKHSLINSRDLFDWTYDNRKKLISMEPEDLIELIYKNLLVKAEIVEKDEHEKSIRAFLNFGHTFAHAIEKEYGYTSELLHGEAVAIGTMAALFLSEKVFNIDKVIIKKTEEILKCFNLRTKIKLNSFENILDTLKRDKKNNSKNINFVLLSEIGAPTLKNDLELDLIKDAYSFITE